MEILNMNRIELAMTDYWGERCPDYQNGCSCCESWKEYDRLILKKNVCKQKQSIEDNFFKDCIRRLSSCSEKDGLFPFAGQEFRNYIIKMFKLLQKERRKKLKQNHMCLETNTVSGRHESLDMSNKIKEKRKWKKKIC
jgi:hypothetical protein